MRSLIFLVPALTIAIAASASCAANSNDAALPQRAAGLWELTKSVEGNPRPMPSILQCASPETDHSIGGNAFLANYLGCSSVSVARDDDGWIIRSVCKSEAGEMREITKLTGDLKANYSMEQDAIFPDYDMTVRQTVIARRIGNCTANQKPGNLYVSGEQFSLQTTTK